MTSHWPNCMCPREMCTPCGYNAYNCPGPPGWRRILWAPAEWPVWQTCPSLSRHSNPRWSKRLTEYQQIPCSMVYTPYLVRVAGYDLSRNALYMSAGPGRIFLGPIHPSLCLAYPPGEHYLSVPRIAWKPLWRQVDGIVLTGLWGNIVPHRGTLYSSPFHLQ